MLGIWIVIIHYNFIQVQVSIDGTVNLFPVLLLKLRTCLLSEIERVKV